MFKYLNMRLYIYIYRSIYIYMLDVAAFPGISKCLSEFPKLHSTEDFSPWMMSLRDPMRCGSVRFKVFVR